MGSVAPLLVTAPFVLILLASAWWAERRYARFDWLPSHFGFSGAANSFVPRRLMTLGLPLTLGTVLTFIAAASIFAPADLHDSSPAASVVISGAGMLFAEGLTLWLVECWVRNQR